MHTRNLNWNHTASTTMKMKKKTTTNKGFPQCGVYSGSLCFFIDLSFPCFKIICGHVVKKTFFSCFTTA